MKDYNQFTNDELNKQISMLWEEHQANEEENHWYEREIEGIEDELRNRGAEITA